VPVTVVTGFLGAGKTTLLRAFLATPEGQGTAVVVNDRGFVEVDEWCRTAEPGVFAVGDVIAGPQLAHVGYAEAILVVKQILGLPVDQEFWVPDDVLEFYREAGARRVVEVRAITDAPAPGDAAARLAARLSEAS